MVTAFLWVIAGLLIVQTVCEIICIAARHAPPRTIGGMAMNVGVNSALAAWAVVLLVKA